MCSRAHWAGHRAHNTALSILDGTREERMHCVACDTLLPDDTARCPRCRQSPFLDRQYRLEAQIGRGANGTVYRASDIRGREKLAIKELPYRHSLPPKQLELLEREAAVLQQLSHPAIPRFIGKVVAGEGKARAIYLIQEFVEGESLADSLPSHRYTEEEVCTILTEVSEILAYLHSLSPPVVHRDIKPSNLMRRPDGTIALIDFGSVQDALQDPELGGSTVAGTFGFMAPEQFLGECSPATDYYGLGATAVALLSRQDPTKLQDRTGALRWERAIQPSPQVAQLLRQLLNDDPEQRLSSPEQMQQVLHSSPPAAAPAPLLEQSRLKDASPEPLAELFEPDQAIISSQDTSATIRRRVPRWLVQVLVSSALIGLFLVVMLPSQPPELPTPPPVPALDGTDAVPVTWTEVKSRIRVEPRFPEAAKQLNITEETCRVKFYIDEQGEPYDVQVEECHELFHENVLDAAWKWRFYPYENPDGDAIKSFFTLKFTFRLR